MALVLDQSQLGHVDYGAIIYSTNYESQTFKSSKTGKLQVIKLYAQRVNNPNNLIVELRNVVDSKPGSIIYATEEINASVIGTGDTEFSVTFSSPYAITADSSYAIVLYQKSNGGNISNKYAMGRYYNSIYVDGAELQSSDSGSNWATGADPYDLYFETWVNVQRTSSPLPMFFKS